MEEVQTLEQFRGFVLRGSGMAALALVAIVAGGGLLIDRRYQPLVLASMAISGAAVFARWHRILSRPSGQWIAWGWVVAATAGLFATTFIPGFSIAAQPLFVLVVALSGLVLDRIKHIFVGVLAVSLAALSVIETEGLLLSGVVIPAATVGLVALGFLVVGARFERLSRRDSERMGKMVDQHQRFERLYELATIVGGGESLRDVMPRLVGTLCRYLQAQSGMVFLHRPAAVRLELTKPVWREGNEVQFDGDWEVDLRGGDVIGHVFRSGRAMRLDQIGRSPRYATLAELGVQTALLVPLIVDSERVGVIVLADATEGLFTDEQLGELRSLATPVALVLRQLDRFEAAAEKNRRLEELTQMKSDFVSVVSHELRSPLTAIIGSLDTIARPELLPSDERAQDLLASARRQSRQLRSLIEDLLVASRVERNTLAFELEPVRLDVMLEAATAASPVDNVTVSIEPTNLTVLSDRDHLQRVFINLLENAAKYAPGSRVDISARRSGGRVEVTVADHGAGIPEGQKARIFEPFTQLEGSATRQKGGAGLGLSIARSLVEAMRGRIDITDTEGGGATFTIILPFASSTAAQLPLDGIAAPLPRLHVVSGN